MLNLAAKIAIGLALAFFVYRLISGKKQPHPPGDDGNATDHGWSDEDGDGDGGD